MAEKTYAIVTEDTSDLPFKYYNEHSITVIPLFYSVDGTDYCALTENTLPAHEFYEKLRHGSISKTAQVSPERAMDYYRALLDQGLDILHICFSSGLSGSYQSETIARDELKEQYPDREIVCVDSLCASLGQGLFVDFAVRKREEGMPLKELGQLLEDTRLNLCHYFTVDDLNHLYRGGRVSKTAAIFGTLLGIKPILHVDDEGKLIPIGKIRGRKASLDSLVKKMGTKLGGHDNPYVFISHGDCIEDAQYVSEKVKEAYGLDTAIIEQIGPIIGTHSGPGTVALFFLGKDRTEEKL